MTKTLQIPSLLHSKVGWWKWGNHYVQTTYLSLRTSSTHLTAEFVSLEYFPSRPPEGVLAGVLLQLVFMLCVYVVPCSSYCSVSCLVTRFPFILMFCPIYTCPVISVFVKSLYSRVGFLRQVVACFKCSHVLFILCHVQVNLCCQICYVLIKFWLSFILHLGLIFGKVRVRAHGGVPGLSPNFDSISPYNFTLSLGKCQNKTLLNLTLL